MVLCAIPESFFLHHLVHLSVAERRKCGNTFARTAKSIPPQDHSREQLGKCRCGASDYVRAWRRSDTLQRKRARGVWLGTVCGSAVLPWSFFRSSSRLPST